MSGFDTSHPPAAPTKRDNLYKPVVLKDGALHQSQNAARTTRAAAWAKQVQIDLKQKKLFVKKRFVHKAPPTLRKCRRRRPNKPARSKDSSKLLTKIEGNLCR